MRCVRRWLQPLALLALGGCAFDAAEAGLEVVNKCSMAAQCGPDAECQDGVCITQKADAPLTIALEVTPVRLPDGSDPLPIVIAPFEVDGPIERTLELIDPVVVSGIVRQLDRPLEADVSFTPLGTIRGIPAKTITVSTAPNANMTRSIDFEARLLRGREYRVVVRPRDTSLPPHETTTMASAQEQLTIQYPDNSELPARTVEVSGAYSKLILRVRALRADGAEPISSTATVEEGKATLRFATEPGNFRLEIRPEASYPESRPQVVANNALCDSNTPTYPVFTASAEDVTGADGVLRVELRELPAHIPVAGTVRLCDAGLDGDLPLESGSLTLHAADLLPDDAVLAASFDASTTTRFDPEFPDGLSFCVQVIPGSNYQVLATPASSLPCALLSDLRPITAPRSGQQVIELQLPEAAYVSGTLRTMDGMPLRGAAIDAIALGDAMSYNRSRSTSSGADGSFRLQVDLGNYDVVFKPAPGSGLPWQVRYDVPIGSAKDISTTIDMYLPIPVGGSLRYRGGAVGDPSLKSAVISAYAIVEGDEGERAVPIGSTTADDAGRFTLLLPPSIQRRLW